MRRSALAASVLWTLGWGAVAFAAAPAPGAFTLGPPPPAQVKRVVTQVPSLTELVLALGKGEVLVGVSRFDVLPEVSALPRIGGFVDPSVEAVLALRPELLLVQPGPGNERPVRKLAELGVPVLALPLQNVADVLTAMRRVGAALGVKARGEALAAELERARADVRRRSSGFKRMRVLFVYGFEPLIVAGPGSFADELLADAGAVNAAEKAPSAYAPMSIESALLARPDVVIDASDTAQGRDELHALPGLAQARWVKLPSQDLLHPGPRLVKGLEELFEALHSEQARGH